MRDEDTSAESTDGGFPTDFGSRVAHEIRGPLNLVAGALSEVGAIDDAKTRLLQLAERGVAKLGRLADRLSLLSRVETGGLQIGASRSDLYGIADAASERGRQLVGRRRVELTICGERSAPVEVDSSLIGMAVQELVENALRHARAQVQVRIESSDGQARVEVSDDGRGVSPEDPESLFLRHGVDAPRGGLHIGLSLARAIARAHGGDARFEGSIPGERTTFSLVLPTRQSP